MVTVDKAIVWFNAVASKIKETPNFNRRKQLAAILLSLFLKAYMDLMRKKLKSVYYQPYIPSAADFKAAEEIAFFLVTAIKDPDERAAWISRLYRQMEYYFQNYEELGVSADKVLSFAVFHKKLREIDSRLEANVVPVE
jgi:hypothetical protein